MLGRLNVKNLALVSSHHI